MWSILIFVSFQVFLNSALDVNLFKPALLNLEVKQTSLEEISVTWEPGVDSTPNKVIALLVVGSTTTTYTENISIKKITITNFPAQMEVNVIVKIASTELKSSTFTTWPPAASAVPSLEAIGVGARSINVQWQGLEAPTDLFAGYQVKIIEKDTNKNIHTYEEVFQTVYPKSLQPFTKYKVQLRGKNKANKDNLGGGYGPISEQITQTFAQKASPPSFVKVISKNSTFARVSWIGEHDAGFIGYKVTFISLDYGGKIVHDKIPFNNYSTNLLYPFTMYNVTVQSENSNNMDGIGGTVSKPGYCIMQTLPGGSFKPTVESIVQDNHAGIMVNWRAPMNLIGEVERYVIEAQETDKPNEHSEYTVDGAQTNYHITALKPLTKYVIKATAHIKKTFNNLGGGPGPKVILGEVLIAPVIGTSKETQLIGYIVDVSPGGISGIVIMVFVILILSVGIAILVFRGQQKDNSETMKFSWGD